MKFLVVTPAKNEGAFIRMTIESVIGQTLQPKLWVIVDDGSTDNTASIVQEYVEKHCWIKLIKKTTSNEVRTGGSKVVRAFYTGYEKFKDVDHDVIMKMDADLTLPKNYFHEVSREYSQNPKVGLCGGYCVIEKNGELIKEHSADFHLRGALKAYRTETFKEIGGFMETWSWDGIDGMMAMHKGWKIKILDLPVVHHRPTSAAYEPKQHALKSGKEAYRTGSDIGLTLVRTLLRIKDKPKIIAAFYYLRGFLHALLSSEERIVDKDLARFIRKFHYRRIINLKTH